MGRCRGPSRRKYSFDSRARASSPGEGGPVHWLLDHQCNINLSRISLRQPYLFGTWRLPRFRYGHSPSQGTPTLSVTSSASTLGPKPILPAVHSQAKGAPPGACFFFAPPRQVSDPGRGWVGVGHISGPSAFGRAEEAVLQTRGRSAAAIGTRIQGSPDRRLVLK